MSIIYLVASFIVTSGGSDFETDFLICWALFSIADATWINMLRGK